MSKIISETFYGSLPEPQWLVESPKEQQSHFDQRGCVRQIKSSSSHLASQYPSQHTEKYDLPSSRSSRASYFSEQPSMTSVDHRQAHHVQYNAIPATHRTPAALNTSFNIPIVEFMVPLCCGKCEEKVKEELENDKGVYRVVCDLHNQRVTVSSNADPQRLLKRIKRIKKNSHFWRGSTYFKDAQYLTSSFPTHKPSHHSQQVLPQQLGHHLQTREPAVHHRRLSSQMLSQNQRYSVAPRSISYDGHVEPQFQNKKDDSEYYYAGAEYGQYKSSSPYNTSFHDAQVYDGSPYTADFPIPDVNDSLHHGHLSYDLAYETGDYPLHLTGYY